MSKVRNIKNIRKTKARTNKRYNILIVGTIILAFLLITVVYLKLMEDSSVNWKIQEMQHAVSVASKTLEDDEYVKTLSKLPSSTKKNLDTIADVSNTYLWIVKPSGHLFYVSDIPEAALHGIKVVQDNDYFLVEPPNVLQNLDNQVTLNGGNFFGVFDSDSGDWVIIIEPLYTSSGELWANMLVHYPLSEILLSSSHIFLGLGIVLLMAIIVATVIIKGYVNRVSEPMNKLAEAANLVAQGDYDARVSLSWTDEEEEQAVFLEEQDDDWTNLVLTFNRMVEQMQSQKREQSDFIASISHDLRTPLTSISGFVTAMLDGTIPPELHEKYLKTVQDESKRLSQLVSDMNTMISLEQSPSDLELKEFNINQLIAKVIDSMEVLLEAKHITVQTNARSIHQNEVMVLANESQIERVLHNLISNAIKFVDDNGIISVRTDLRGRNLARITIEDNGPGIAQEDIPFIFDRFFKSDRSRTGRKGSGLGLYICKKILQAHGQSIFASKSILGGAKFEFTLALA